MKGVLAKLNLYIFQLICIIVARKVKYYNFTIELDFNFHRLSTFLVQLYNLIFCMELLVNCQLKRGTVILT